jgi:membrane protease YdiL (CAAX protease family)
MGRAEPMHPVARLGAFVLGTALASVVFEALVYPVVVTALGAIGVHVPLHAWFGVAALVAGTAVAVHYTEAAGATFVGLAGLDRRAWRPVAVLVSGAQGVAAIGAAMLGLLAAGWLRVESMPAGHVLSAMARAAFELAPAAMLEELLVRGYALTVLSQWIGWRNAIGVTSMAFALMHVANPGATTLSLTVVLLAGIFLGVVRWRTGSTVAAAAAHFGWNFAMVGLAHAAVSGVAFATPGYRLADAGPSWITGGAWGPEGGAAAGLALLVAIGALVWRRHDASATLTSTSRPGGRTEPAA